MPDSEPNPELHGLDPGELLARAMQTAQPSAGSTAWLPPAPEEVAALLPQYRIESLLGHGGMGAVYKGSQATLDRAVAIKLLPAEIAADESFVARFTREARTLAQLQHPGIVAVHDFGQTGAGHLYFVMEYVDGTDLQKILRGPRLQPAQALEAICQICEALQYAHGQGVIHRDIKPANILFTREGRAKLADFGLARPSAEDPGGLTHTQMAVGTPDYMAPEQREGHADQRADIYALGVMLYEMLTGQRPQGIFAPPSERVSVDARIDAVVVKALQQEPARRYQQVREMQTDVDRIRSTPRHGVPRVIAPRRRPLAIAAAILVPLLALGGFLFWKNGRPPATVAAASAQSAATPAPIVAEPKPIVMEPILATKEEPTPVTPEPKATLIPSAKPSLPVVALSTPALAVMPPPTAPDPAQALLQVFSKQIPNLSAWVLSPLDQSFPTDIRQNLTYLREDLADEATRKPIASPDAYRLGTQLCNTLTAILDERTQTQARAGFRSVEANARTGVTSQALEARRNYMMSWPQYAREGSQRAELKSQAVNNAALMAERPKLDWSQRAAQLGKTIDTLYVQFRAALRQPSPRK